MGISFSDKVYGNLGTTTTNDVMVKVPRFKFNFLLQIQLKDQPSRIDFERVRTVTLPDISFDTKIVNQYNIKRVVQTKMNYGPCTVTFFDTYDSDFLRKIVLPYTRNHYNTGEGTGVITDASARQVSTVADTFTGNIGLTATTLENRYFIPEIRIIKLGPVEHNFYHIMKNCLITNIAGDTLDYGDSQPVQFTVTFQPERVELTSVPDATRTQP
jgi:hypothetical protein